MKDKIRLGFIGFGLRRHLLRQCMELSHVTLAAVCDLQPDRVSQMKKLVCDCGGKEPYGSCDYHDLIKNAGLDAVIICTSWSAHIPLAIDFMNAGIAVGCEVGGCDSLNQIWELVKCYRRTKTPFMMLENCCFGRQEMLVLNMVKQGLFGSIVHCDGGYHHYLCDEITDGKNYRLKNYIHRNCDNYPTHALGPIAKLLNINRGNRFLYLTSVASKSCGLKAYVKNNDIEKSELRDVSFNQGDVISTSIKCAGGETIALSLATTTPVISSRRFNVYASKAFFHYDTKSIAMLGDDIDLEKPWQENWNNVEKYFDKYEHPVWKEYLKDGIRGGHGGMDYLVLSSFADSVRKGTRPYIDVYDAAALMAITPLSEESISKGGAPVYIPDFTYGEWIDKNDEE